MSSTMRNSANNVSGKSSNDVCNRLASDLGNAEIAWRDYRSKMVRHAYEIQAIGESVSSMSRFETPKNVFDLIKSATQVAQFLIRGRGYGSLVLGAIKGAEAAKKLMKDYQDFKEAGQDIYTLNKEIERLANLSDKTSKKIEFYRQERERLNCPAPRYR